VFLASRPTAQVQTDRPRVRPQPGGGITIVQPTPITITGTAQPPAANFQTEVEVYALDAQGQVLNGGNPLATATPNFLGLYSVTLRLPSTIRRDLNTIVVRQRAQGFLSGTQQIDGMTLTGLFGQLAIQGTTISDLEASLGLDPGTLTNLQSNLALFGWTAQLDGSILFLQDIIQGTVTNPDVIGGLLDGTADLSGRTGTLSQGNGTVGPTEGTFTQTGSATISANSGGVRIDVTEFAVSDPIRVAIHQSRRLRPPNGGPVVPPPNGGGDPPGGDPPGGDPPGGDPPDDNRDPVDPRRGDSELLKMKVRRRAARPLPRNALVALRGAGGLRTAAFTPPALANRPALRLGSHAHAG
jgi:hypothetical protein